QYSNWNQQLCLLRRYPHAIRRPHKAGISRRLMTKAEIFTDPAFLRLSEQQQAFVRSLVENGGDKLAAAHEAYTCKDDFTARTMANRCLRKLQIKRIVDGYFGEELKDSYPSREEMAALAWQRAQNADDDKVAVTWATL